MKYFIILTLFSFLVFSGCKNEKKATKLSPEKEQTIVEKIANAHGYEKWKSVNTLKFTFNVNKDTSHFERTWVWKPKTNWVTSITNADTLTYDRKKMDSVAHKNHGGFINDKYWLLPQFQLLWDAKSYTKEHSINEIAPISKKPMQKLTIVYGSDGGYTPGDAYDIYFEEDFLIREWIFRRANQTEPTMATTFEDYKLINGISIATTHINKEEKFNLYFTGVEINKSSN